MNRRTLIKSFLPLIAAGATQNIKAAPPKFSRTQLKKNIVLVTVGLGIYADNFRNGKNECQYFKQYFKDFTDDVTYFNNLCQPGMGGGHAAEHATFTTLKYVDRDKYPNRSFISLDQHLAEYSKQETRHKYIYHKITGSGENVSFNSLGQPTPSFNGLEKLHTNLFGYTDMGKVKQEIAKHRFILKELYNNTKRRWSGTQEEQDMVASIDYKIKELDEKVKWLKVKKPKMAPKFKSSEIKKSPLVNAHENFNTIFQALEKKQTKIATVQFAGNLTKGVPGISHGYHTLSHHSNYSERVEELKTVDSYILKSLQGFLNQLRDAKMLDDTLVLFTCALGDANRHSNKNIPAFLFGGGFNHYNCIECKDESGKQVITTAQLYSTILKQAGFNDPSFSGNKEIINAIV